MSNIPDMEKWRMHLLDKGYKKGYAKGKSEVVTEIVVDHEAVNQAERVIINEYEGKISDLNQAHKAEIDKLNETYSHRRGLDADIIKRLKVQLEKLQKK